MSRKSENEKIKEIISQVPGSLGDTSGKDPGAVIDPEVKKEELQDPDNLLDDPENKEKELQASQGNDPPEGNKPQYEVPRDPDMKISEHISYKEATESETATELEIDNNPPDEILEVMKVTAEKLFEPLRRFWKCIIAVTSFYRSPELNAALEKDKKIKASKKSQHMNGEAMDLNGNVYGNINNRQIFEYLRDNVMFDQLIWEHGDDNEPDWVHVSFKAGANRMQVLRSYYVGSRIYYDALN